MLISFENIFFKYGLDPSRQILHLGAHECEERDVYLKMGFKDENIFWIEGNSDLVNKIKNRNSNIKVYDALISDKEEEVSFIITNNFQSSSILELGDHKTEHPHIHETHRIHKKTSTLNQFIKENKIDPNQIEFINIDIQGVEYQALVGGDQLLGKVKYLYLEVNVKELYVGGKLLSDLDQLLGKYGYSRVETSMTRHGWGDALYVLIK